MNATDCARATEPHSRTARHKARLKLTARRPASCGCGTSANMATISPVRIIRAGSAAAVLRIVTRGSPSTTKIECLALDPPPDQAAPATLFSDRYCQGGGVELSSSQG